MKSLNLSRILLGAFVSGLVLLVVSGIVNGAVLGDEWKSWQNTFGILSHPPSPAIGMIIWAVVSLIYGLAGVWIYAGIRACYGAGGRTALIAGFILWLSGSFTTLLGHLALADIPEHIAFINCLAFLIGDPLAVLAGAYFYKD